MAPSWAGRGGGLVHQLGPLRLRLVLEHDLGVGVPAPARDDLARVLHEGAVLLRATGKDALYCDKLSANWRGIKAEEKVIVGYA